MNARACCLAEPRASDLRCRNGPKVSATPHSKPGVLWSRHSVPPRLSNVLTLSPSRRHANENRESSAGEVGCPKTPLGRSLLGPDQFQ